MKRMLYTSAVTVRDRVVLPRFCGGQGQGRQGEPGSAQGGSNEFVGEWNGNGGRRTRPGSKDLWSETVTWTCKFKGDDAWL